MGRDRHGFSLSVSPSCRLTPAPDLSAAHPVRKAHSPPNPILTLRTEQLEASESDHWLLPLPSQGLSCRRARARKPLQAAPDPSAMCPTKRGCFLTHRTWPLCLPAPSPHWGGGERARKPGATLPSPTNTEIARAGWQRPAAPKGIISSQGSASCSWQFSHQPRSSIPPLPP